MIYDTVTVTNNVTKYDTITITNNVTKYDTVKVNKTIYDTVTVTNNVTKYDTVLVNVYDTIKIIDTVNVLKIKFKLTTGIKASQFASIKVYPNPTSDVLIIDVSDLLAMKGYRYKIMDAVGKEVYNEFVKEAGTLISLKTLGSSGIYVLSIIDENNKSIENKKILLE
jgi:hypothetical protein